MRSNGMSHAPSPCCPFLLLPTHNNHGGFIASYSLVVLSKGHLGESEEKEIKQSVEVVIKVILGRPTICLIAGDGRVIPVHYLSAQREELVQTIWLGRRKVGRLFEKKENEFVAYVEGLRFARQTGEGVRRGQYLAAQIG